MASGSRILVTAKHALQVLQLFSGERAELGVTEMSQQLGLAKSVISRIVSTLVEEDMLEENEMTRTYRLSPLLSEYGLIAEEASVFIQLVQPHIIKISRQLGETVRFHVREEDTLVTVVIALDGNVGVAGQRVPLLSSIPGIVLLAFTENDPLGYLSHSTASQTIHFNRADVLQLLEMAEFEGYAEGPELSLTNMYTCACPVFNQIGDVLGVVSITLPRTFPSHIDSVAKAAAKLAQSISIRLATLNEYHLSSE